MKIPKKLQKYINKHSLVSLDHSDNSVILRGAEQDIVIAWRQTAKKKAVEYNASIVDSDAEVNLYHKSPKKALSAFYKGIRLSKLVNPKNTHAMPDKLYQLYMAYKASDKLKIHSITSDQWECAMLGIALPVDCLSIETYSEDTEDIDEYNVCIIPVKDTYVVSCESVDKIMFYPKNNVDPEASLKEFQDLYGKTLGINTLEYRTGE